MLLANASIAIYSGFPKELSKEAMHGDPEICPIHHRQEFWYIYFTLIVRVKVVGRPDLADWKTKICLIIVLKQVEEEVRSCFGKW